MSFSFRGHLNTQINVLLEESLSINEKKQAAYYSESDLDNFIALKEAIMCSLPCPQSHRQHPTCYMSKKQINKQTEAGEGQQDEVNKRQIK